MAVLNQIPAQYTPTLMVDIRDTLNANGATVTDNLTTFFTRSANLTPWSRRKPVVDTLNVQPILMTTADMAEQLNSSGVVVSRYGVEIFGGAQTPAELFTIVNMVRQGYYYALPQAGAANQPMRLSDFNGYLPTAQMPLHTTFPDGYEFAYLQYDYPLTGIELQDSGNPDYGQLYRKDLYPTKDSNGNAITLNRGVYIRLDDGSYDFAVVGALNFKSDKPVGLALSKLAGKDFTIMEFLTNAPTTWSSFAVEDFVASGYSCYALPEPLSHCSMASSGGGTAPTIKVARVVFQQVPIFFGISATDYSTVSASFQISSVGDLYSGGNITSFACGIYSDAACTQIIQRQQFTSFTLGAENVSSTYSVKLTNNTGNSGIYFGVWFNGTLQYSGSVRMQITASQVSEINNL